MSVNFIPSEVRVYFGLLLGDLPRDGRREYRGRCPVHNGKNYNFVVDSDNGLSYCFSKCGRGWDMIGLDQEIFGGNFSDAIRRVFVTVGRQFEESSRAEFRQTREQRERDRNDLARALCWRHIVLQRIEKRLEGDKHYLFADDADSEAAAILVSRDTKRQQQIQAFTNGELVVEFRLRLDEQPSLTRELVREGAEDLEDSRLACVAIVRALEISVSQFPAIGVKKLGGSN